MSQSIFDNFETGASDYEISDSESDYIPSASESSDDEVEKNAKKGKQGKKEKRGKKKASKSSFLPDSDDNWDEVDGPTLAEYRARLQAIDEDEDRALAELLNKPTWVDMPFNPPDFNFKGQLETAPDDGMLKTPYQFFKELVTDDMIENIQKNTNDYALEKNGKELKTGKKEIEAFIGIYLRMGLMQASCVRAFWESDTRYPHVADVMARDRFEALASNLHFVKNGDITEADRNKDRMWKLRPWLNGLKQSMAKIQPERHDSVDEIMVPFKGRSVLKQYIRGKPHPWGIKLWGRAGASGMLYDFEVYQGSITEKGTDSIGVGGDVVIRMISGLPSGKNYLIFADNFFTSLPLVERLQQRQIQFIGTVRPNRLKGLDLKSEKQLKKEGRGSCDSKVELNSNVFALRWYDNRAVNIVSTYKGVEPRKMVKRWDKKERKTVEVPCPDAIVEYNKFMGKIDLLDSLSALYKYRVRTKRWYLKVFYHTVTMALVTSWLWYRRHCVLLNVKHVKLSVFQARVATALIETKRPMGRPSSSPLPGPPARKVCKRKSPVDDVRKDGIDHLPDWAVKRDRCQHCNAHAHKL